VAIYRSKYDAYGNNTEAACYNMNDKLTVNKKWGFSIVRVKYDDRGKMPEIRRFTKD
jgi:hypothetical protein